MSLRFPNFGFTIHGLQFTLSLAPSPQSSPIKGEEEILGNIYHTVTFPPQAGENRSKFLFSQERQRENHHEFTNL
jgi:hypothetical protein